MPQVVVIDIFVENKSPPALTKKKKKPIYRDQSKHINISYLFIQEYISRKEVQLEFMKSND